MDSLVDFFCQVGELKKMPRRGWVINNIKNPESIAEHIFRAALMSWFLGQKKDKTLNIERLIKIALVHDLCEVYAGDATPYDHLLSEDKKANKKAVKNWPRMSKEQKEKIVSVKYNREKEGLEKLISKLPADLKKEITGLWMDYEMGLTKEGRFFKQADRVENLLQAMEYWKAYKKPHQKPLWHWAREYFDDSFLLDFIKEMEAKFYVSPDK